MLGHRTTFITMVIAATARAWATLAVGQPGGDVRVELTRDYLIVVRGQVGDRSGLTVVVDTGSLPTLVDSRIGRPFLKSALKVPVDSLTGTSELESAVLPSLAVGKFSALEVPVLVTDLSCLEPQFGVRPDVVLGVGVLRGACFSIDYVRRTLSFACRDDWRRSRPLDRRSALLVVDVTIDGTPLQLRVDTGSPALVLYDEAVPEGWRSRVDAEITGYDFSGPVRFRRLIADVITLGPASWHRRPVYILPAGVSRQSYDGVLGIRALGMAAVQFDLQRMTLSWND